MHSLDAQALFCGLDPGLTPENTQIIFFTWDLNWVNGIQSKGLIL